MELLQSVLPAGLLAFLESQGAVPSQTMAIEGGSVEKGQEKEWYYGNDAKSKRSGGLQ